MSRGSVRRLVTLVVGVAAGCATAPRSEPGSFVAPGFSAERLGRERVAVLPVDAVRLPAELPEGLGRDSLETSLAIRAADVLATALVERGAAGRALGPGVIAPALELVGSAGLGRAYEAILRGPPHRQNEGALPEVAVEEYRSLSRAVGARYFLVPLALELTPVEPLRFAAEVDLALVDAGAGRTVWRAAAVARNPVAPPGDAADLFAAALEDALVAVADRAARRLATVGDLDPDEPIEDVP